MSPRRRIALLTTGRQDYGILRSTALLLRSDPRFELSLWAGGMHLSSLFGSTVEFIERDDFVIEERLAFLGEPPDPVVDSARALMQVHQALLRHEPVALVLVGDRSETLAAGFAATLAGVPIVHFHGGEETEGAVDNVLRHALTKLSHLHFVTHDSHARRVRQMGEGDNLIHVVSPPGLDNLYRDDLPGRSALEGLIGITLEDPVVLTTMHATTLGQGEALAEVSALTAAMAMVDATYIVTEPNADPGGDLIRAHLHTWASGRPNVKVVKALGELRYFGLLRLASCVLGNSSSGLVEAPALGLPVVNVGDRQKGRIRSAHHLDVPADARAIREALEIALRPQTRARLQEATPPYPRGPAAPKIVETLAQAEFARWQRKAFVDREGGSR